MRRFKCALWLSKASDLKLNSQTIWSESFPLDGSADANCYQMWLFRLWNLTSNLIFVLLAGSTSWVTIIFGNLFVSCRMKSFVMISSAQRVTHVTQCYISNLLQKKDKEKSQGSYCLYFRKGWKQSVQHWNKFSN